jgi:hypothetical protein
MQSCDYRHFEVLQQLRDVVSGLASEDSKFMLQAHQIDVARIQELGGRPVGRDIVFADLESHPLRVGVGCVLVVDSYHRQLGGSILGSDRIA